MQGKIKVLFDPNTFETKHTDFVQIEANDDGVYITFLQRMPGNASEDNSVTAKALARFAVSWTHFGRIAKMFNRAVEENREKYMKVVEDSLFKGEN